MSRTPSVTDADILDALAEGSKTAAELGVPAARLKNLEGVHVAGTKQTGQRGRPALVFALDA